MKIFINLRPNLIENIISNNFNKININQLLKYLDYEITSVVIEYNGLVIESSRSEKILIKDGDKLEILSIVGGG